MEQSSALTISRSDLENFKKFAVQLAAVAGEVSRQYFRTPLNPEMKSDNSPVTIADKLAEERIRALIEREFPDHGILGEEFGVHNQGARFTWVIDPIDGTKSFICGGVDFGNMVALLDHGAPIIGVVNQPILREMMVGDNSSTTLNEKPVHARQCTDVSKAILLSTDLFNIGKYQHQQGFDTLRSKVSFSRTYGNCYGYCLVAAGLCDIMIDPIMNTWDIMALVPIVQGAGACITDYQGNNPVHGTSTVASHPSIHQEVVRILNCQGGS